MPSRPGDAEVRHAGSAGELTEADQAGTDREAERAPSVGTERGARSLHSLAALWANAKKLWVRHPRRACFAAALAVYAAYECVLRAFEMPMVLYWAKMQLLDRAYLLAHPVDSLVYLHSQPPVLNSIALIVLHVSDLTGISEAAVASGLFASLAFGCFCALLKVARLATGSKFVSAACGALLLLSPACGFYRHRLLYGIPALLAGLLVSWSWLLVLRDGKRAQWVTLMLSLALLCATKSLFHPLLALLVALLALGARRAVSDVAWADLVRRYAAGFVLGTLLVLLWPAKNQIVFGHFVYSSWLGFNLTVRTATEPYEPFEDFTDHGQIHPSIRPQIEAFEGVFPDDDLSIVRAVKKPSFEKIPNWNHLAVLYTNAELTRRGIDWRLRHPVEWMRMATGRYFMTMRPSFVFPYSAKRIFSAGGAIRRVRESLSRHRASGPPSVVRARGSRLVRPSLCGHPKSAHSVHAVCVRLSAVPDRVRGRCGSKTPRADRLVVGALRTDVGLDDLRARAHGRCGGQPDAPCNSAPGLCQCVRAASARGPSAASGERRLRRFFCEESKGRKRRPMTP